MDDNGDPTDELSSEVLDFCQQNGVTATKVSEIVANKEPAIYKAIQEGLERINAKATSNAQRVQKWVILERDFSVGGGELGEFLLLWLLAFKLGQRSTHDTIIMEGGSTLFITVRSAFNQGHLVIRQAV